MTCLSPTIEQTLTAYIPLDLDISFMMDGMCLVPDENILTIGYDPIYYPFKNEIQEMNELQTIEFHVGEYYRYDS
jgi:hypothetical protein